MEYATEENLTDLALMRWEACHSPRFRLIMQSLIKHLHAVVREVELTEQEWLFAATWLAKTGQLCTEKRQEFILLSDVLGISMLVDAINHRLPTAATPSTVMGPFHIDGSPELPMGADMAAGLKGDPCFLVGTVKDLNGKPIEGAELDLWQTDADGLYESQVDTTGPHMRALFHTGSDGKYTIRTIAPLGYSIPMDGTVGDLMRATAISHFRPAHIHFHISAHGYQPLVTHLFRKGAKYLESDVVFGVKERLITGFEQLPPGKAPTGEKLSQPFFVVRYDFLLSKSQARKQPKARQAAR
jgi:hydroxyquinol 1,2-dioxygenase